MSDGGFEAFVAERSTALLRTAYLLTDDRARARDLLQTGLIAVHRDWAELAPGQAAVRARHELVAAHTSPRRRIWLGDLLSSVPAVAGLSGLPGFASPVSEPGPPDEVTAALAQLPPRQRAALVLRHGEELSEEATAEALGGTVADARAQLRLGLDRLADLLPDRPADALVERLHVALTRRAAEIAAAPADTHERVLEGAGSQRRHLAGVAALAGFVLLVVVLVALTV